MRANKKTIHKDERKFIYAYHTQPDTMLHEFGTNAHCITEMIKNYNSQLEALVEGLCDTLFLVTADHGMTDIVMKRVEDYPKINNALLRHICLEPRCCSLYVKDKYVAGFPKIFNETFPDKFVLFTHNEFLQSGLLGEGLQHPKIKDFVGDYVAVAISDIAIWYKNINGEFTNFKGTHAGLSNEELTVPLITIEKHAI